MTYRICSKCGGKIHRNDFCWMCSKERWPRLFTILYGEADPPRKDRQL